MRKFHGIFGERQVSRVWSSSWIELGGGISEQLVRKIGSVLAREDFRNALQWTAQDSTYERCL